MKLHYTTRIYTSEAGARAAARRRFNKEGGIYSMSGGLRYAWNMDNVIIEPEGYGFAWHVELGSPIGPDDTAELDDDEELDIEAFFDACRQRKIPDTIEMVDAYREMEEAIGEAEAEECMALFVENAESRARTTWRKPSAVMIQWVIAGLAEDGYGEKLTPTAHEIQKAAKWDAACGEDPVHAFNVLDFEPMPEGLKQALADAFARQQTGRAELDRRRADAAGLAGSGFRPRF